MAEAAAAQPSRRRPGQLQEDVVRAAAELFVERGFDGTSIRDIAGRAGTTQAMLYRYYPGKMAIFEAAVLAPFERFLYDFVEDWRTRTVTELPNRELFDRFNTQLYDLAVENRKLILTLLSADTFVDGAIGDFAGMLTSGISDVIEQLKADQHNRGWEDLDIDVAGRAVIAMIVGTAILDPWLFGDATNRPGRNRILGELTELQLTGTSRRPPRS